MSGMVKARLTPTLLVAINTKTNIQIVRTYNKLFNINFKLGMGRRKVKESRNVNRIKDVAKQLGASSRLISLWVNVDYTTVSGWNSNTSQPSHENLDQIGELLQKDNRELLEPQNRVNTGLAKALEQELQRLRKVEGTPYEIEKLDLKKGKSVKVNNPELIKALKKFAEKYYMEKK